MKCLTGMIAAATQATIVQLFFFSWSSRFTIAFEDAAPHALVIICAGRLPICKDAFALAIMIFEVSHLPDFQGLSTSEMN